MPRPALYPDRRGRALWPVLLVLLMFGGAGGVFALWKFGWPRGEEGAGPTGPLFHVVQRGEFVHEVVERGEIESSNNVEVRCLVESKNQAGTMIRWIIPEGTDVAAGDKLVELDDSALQDELIQNQILVNTSTALVTQAESALSTAETALKEYTEGTYLQEIETIQGEIAQSEENLRRARQSLQYSKRLAAKGHITPLHLKADEFAVTKARSDYNASVTKLRVLQEFTYRKQIETLEAAVETARVKLDSDRKTHELDVRRLTKTELQIENCTISATCAGQVIYANQADRWGNNQVLIQEGTAVRDRQVLIRLPDPERMQVKARVNESRIDYVRPGMKTTVRLDAFENVEIPGTVIKIDPYPIPGNPASGSVKEYACYIQLEKPSEDISVRAGLTASVRVHVAYQPDVVRVPVSTIKEVGGSYFALLGSDQSKTFTPREVQIGPTNDKLIVVTSGLEPGEEIVQNPGKYLEKVKMPASQEKVTSADKFQPGEVEEMTASVRARAAQQRSAGPPGGGEEGGGPRPPRGATGP